MNKIMAKPNVTFKSKPINNTKNILNAVNSIRAKIEGGSKFCKQYSCSAEFRIDNPKIHKMHLDLYVNQSDNLSVFTIVGNSKKGGSIKNITMKKLSEMLDIIQDDKKIVAFLKDKIKSCSQVM